MIKIGLDVIKGMVGNHSLSIHILSFLHGKDILFLKHIFQQNAHCIDHQAWTRVGELQMTNEYIYLSMGKLYIKTITQNDQEDNMT